MSSAYAVNQTIKTRYFLNRCVMVGGADEVRVSTAFVYQRSTYHAGNKMYLTRNKRASPRFETMLKIQNFMINQLTNIEISNFICEIFDQIQKDLQIEI